MSHPSHILRATVVTISACLGSVYCFGKTVYRPTYCVCPLRFPIARSPRDRGFESDAGEEVFGSLFCWEGWGDIRHIRSDTVRKSRSAPQHRFYPSPLSQMNTTVMSSG